MTNLTHRNQWQKIICSSFDPKNNDRQTWKCNEQDANSSLFKLSNIYIFYNKLRKRFSCRYVSAIITRFWFSKQTNHTKLRCIPVQYCHFPSRDGFNQKESEIIAKFLQIRLANPDIHKHLCQQLILKKIHPRSCYHIRNFIRYFCHFLVKNHRCVNKLQPNRLYKWINSFFFM